jgi:hypothetical protein
MFIHAGLPDSLWLFSVKSVVAVRNRLTHSTTRATPYELFMGLRPCLKNIRVFGFSAYALRMPRGSKLHPRADEGTLLECGDHRIYKILVCRDDSEPQIVESRHVRFDESMFPGANCLLNYLSDEHPDDSDCDLDSDSSSCVEPNSRVESGEEIPLDALE